MTNVLSKLNSNSYALVLLPILLIPVVFYNTTSAMVHVWIVNETFNHGFLVFPFVLWLMWKKKSQILLVQPRPEPRAFLLLILLLIAWLISAVVDVEIVQQFCMITIILTSIGIIAGRQVLSYIFFPLLFLYFSVPFGQALIPPLMQFTADFAVTLIRLVGIPVYRDGLSFALSSGSWSVVEECSGVRYLIASFLLGSIYAYLNYSSTKKRVIFILLSLIVPIIGNGLRAFGIVLIGHFSGMRLAIGADHLLYGWVFFGIIIFLLFYAGSFWRDAEDVANEYDSDEKDSKEQGLIDSRETYSPFIFLAITFLLMTSFAVFANHIDNQKLANVEPVEVSLPVNFSGWQYEDGQLFNWQPIYLNPDKNISRGYISKNGFVQLDIAYYQVQQQGAEAISTSNKLTDPYEGDWRLISSTNIFESDKHFTESEVKYVDQKLLVWSWYRVGRYETPNPYMAKALEAYNLLIEGRTDVSLLSIATQFDDSKETTRQKIYDFWEKSSRDIANTFEQIHNER